MSKEFLKTIELIKKISKIKNELSVFTEKYITDESKLKELFKQFCAEFNEVYSENKEFIIMNSRICDIMEIPDFQIEKTQMSDWVDMYIKVISVNFLTYIRSEKNYDIENIEILLDFYENNPIDTNIKAIVYFLMSQALQNKDVRRSYDYGMKAFELDPDVLKCCNIDKRFDVSELKNEYFNSCPICQSENVSPYMNINQYNFIKDQKCFSPFKMWVKCNECENLFAYNFPVMEMSNINGHYTRKDDDCFIQPTKCLNIYSDIFNKCKQFTDGNKYLEIGVGNGEMLATALEFGYDVTAIEICKDDCEKISSVLGVDIIWSDFLNINIEEKFDIIIMGDVLEHVSRPVDALIKARKLLNDNGVLWISTPNYESGFSRLMKEHDPMWNQLNHFTYFSYRSLKRILEKLEMKVVHYDVSNRYNGSMELYIQKMGSEKLTV